MRSEKKLNDIAGLYLKQGSFHGGEDYERLYDKIFVMNCDSGWRYSFYPFQEIDSVPLKTIAKQKVRRTTTAIVLTILVLILLFILFVGNAIGFAYAISVGIIAIILIILPILLWSYIHREERVLRQWSKLLQHSANDILLAFSQKVHVPDNALASPEIAWREYLALWLYGKIIDTHEIRVSKILMLDLLRDKMTYGWNFETDDLIVDEYNPKLIRYLQYVRVLCPEKLGVVSKAYLVKYASAFSEQFPEEAFESQDLLRDADPFVKEAISSILNSTNVPVIPPSDFINNSLEKQMDYNLLSALCRGVPVRIEASGVYAYPTFMMQKYKSFLLGNS